MPVTSMPMILMPEILVFMMFVMIRVSLADCGPHDFVAQEKRNRFPKVPEAASNWFTRGDFAGQPSKNGEYNQRCRDLQYHELCDCEVSTKWLRNMPFAAQDLRNLKTEAVAHMMKYVVAVPGSHFHQPL